MATKYMWILYAFLAAFTAALVAIFAKVGLQNVDPTLGIGYAGGTFLLSMLLIASLFTWYRSLGTISVDSVSSPKAEMFSWITIMFSQRLGYRLGGLDCRYCQSWLHWCSAHFWSAFSTSSSGSLLDTDI
jgi:uncharacterized membrane-anchored protein